MIGVEENNGIFPQTIRFQTRDGLSHLIVSTQHTVVVISEMLAHLGYVWVLVRHAHVGRFDGRVTEGP